MRAGFRRFCPFRPLGPFSPFFGSFQNVFRVFRGCFGGVFDGVRACVSKKSFQCLSGFEGDS